MKKVDVKCTILSKMEGIDDLEFCTVFGNLMDNAIEAERKVTGKKEIIIFVEEKMGYLRLEIQNKIEKSVLNENSSLNTTKKDTSSHGIGHKSVKRTMQKVGGALKYYETGDLFCAEACVPINKIKRNKKDFVCMKEAKRMRISKNKVLYFLLSVPIIPDRA